MSSANQIPPWNRLAVDAKTAADMMSVGRSTFFARVKDGMYPKSANDGRWNVSELAACRARLTTTPSTPDAGEGTQPGCTQP